MSEYTEVERFEGVWCGQRVRPKRVWRGHRFSDEEVGELLADKTIIVDNLVSANTGNTYGVYGKLMQQTFTDKKTGEEIEFIGFKDLGFISKLDSFSGHVFTAEERERLERGEKVFLSDCVSRTKGTQFSCTVSLVTEAHGVKKLVPEFSKRS